MTSGWVKQLKALKGKHLDKSKSKVVRRRVKDSESEGDKSLWQVEDQDMESCTRMGAASSGNLWHGELRGAG